MERELLNLQSQAVGKLNLDEEIFCLEPRVDLIKLVIDWQRSKRRAGTHHTKTVSEVAGTTKKPFKQKGTGNARQGSLRSAQMRGGGVSHGPVTRSHAIKLPKKVRKLGLKHALSAKLSEGKLHIIDNLELNTSKTFNLVKLLRNFDGNSFFVIGGNEVDSNFALAVRNIKNAVVVPHLGANVYDIVKHDCILLSQDAVNILEKRLK